MSSDDEKMARKATQVFFINMMKAAQAHGPGTVRSNIISMSVPSEIAERPRTLIERDAANLDNFVVHLEASQEPGMTKVVGGDRRAFEHEAAGRPTKIVREEDLPGEQAKLN